MSLRTFIRRWFRDGKLRFIGELLYKSAIAGELAAQTVLDHLLIGDKMQDQTMVNEHLTAIIKTFERPKALRRLLASIKRWYPSLRIIVVDDSRNPVEHDGVQTIVMPFNSGISIGRNEGLKHVATRYMLLLDDDFVFNRHTRLEPALKLMERHPEIDIMGGVVVNLPMLKTINFGTSNLFSTKASPTIPAGSYINGLPVCDMVANFFIGRSDRVRVIGWEPALKKHEHGDFFTRAKGVLTTVLNPGFKCLHAPTPFDQAYMQTRTDSKVEIALLNFRYSRSSYTRSSAMSDEDGKKNG